MNLFQHFTVLLVVLCALTLLRVTAEAGKQRRNKERKRKKATCMDEKKQDRRPRRRVTVCPLNCADTNGNGTLAANTENVKLTSIEDKLYATRTNLDLLGISLKELVDAKSKDGNDDVYPGYGTKELNPKDETKLSSDKEFKLLGQMTWWLTWIEASLRILQEIRQRVEDKELNGNDIVPVVKDKDNGNRFTINSTLKALLTVKSSVNDLHSMLGHDMDATVKNSPFSCQEVRVKQKCPKKLKDPTCTKERIRAYILLRDSHKAVEKMLKALSECNVEEKDTKFALVCNRYVIFLKCQKTLCGLQKNRCKCLSWTYE